LKRALIKEALSEHLHAEPGELGPPQTGESASPAAPIESSARESPRSSETHSDRRESPSARQPAADCPRLPPVCHDRRFSSPLLAIATRRMRRRRAHFIPEGRV
jgi:hypothetical protein